MAPYHFKHVDELLADIGGSGRREMSSRAGRQAPGIAIRGQDCNSALAEKYFKLKMIVEPTLPGVFDIDFEPFI